MHADYEIERDLAQPPQKRMKSCKANLKLNLDYYNDKRYGPPAMIDKLPKPNSRPPKCAKYLELVDERAGDTIVDEAQEDEHDLVKAGGDFRSSKASAGSAQSAGGALQPQEAQNEGPTCRIKEVEESPP
jgi:hypothetical protein